ncbi:MAG: alpha/beta hydrolase [Candidatus Paceibacterota bacterium]|jgi:pimeloyl-ACP methyl ester carboxylesterase
MTIYELKENKINLNGIDLFYKIAGEGKPLLIIHGWGGGSFSWMRIIEELATNGFQVIVPDLPGFGKTESPKEIWGVGDYSKIIDDFIKELGIKEVSVLGHSFGGGIITKMKNIYGKIIFCDAAIVRKDRLSLRQRFSRFISRIGGKLISKNFFAYRFFEKATYFISGTYDYYSANPLMKDIFKKVINEDLSSLVGEIKNPCLIIWGEKDKITPTEDAYFLKEQIANSELAIINNCGHNPHKTNLKELSEIIINYLNK